jgi:hypothetical protein
MFNLFEVLFNYLHMDPYEQIYSKAVYHLDLTPIGLGLRPLATKNRLM